MRLKNLSVQGLEVTLNAFAVTKWEVIMIHILGRSSTLHVKTAPARDLCLYQLDLNNVECIGLFVVKILM